uniref:Uncharacterized protein n=1 Tax=Cacopsylla melanoneura TaxID=428564 RepID=A0A8D8XGI9_9HEMI
MVRWQKIPMSLTSHLGKLPNKNTDDDYYQLCRDIGDVCQSSCLFLTVTFLWVRAAKRPDGEQLSCCLPSLAASFVDPSPSEQIMRTGIFFSLLCCPLGFNILLFFGSTAVLVYTRSFN